MLPFFIVCLLSIGSFCTYIIFPLFFFSLTCELGFWPYCGFCRYLSRAIAILTLAL